jgi:L-amino acid N-acyltransferase YncA
MELCEAHVALRLAAFGRHAGFVGGARAPDRVRAYLGPHHERGRARAWTRDGRLEAIVTWRFDDAAWFGGAGRNVAIDHRLDGESRHLDAWLEPVLDEVLAEATGELDLLVDARYDAAHRVLRSRLGVDSVQLVGDVATARARLRRAPVPAGIRLEPMTSEDIEPVMALYARTFADEPQFCWFGAFPARLASQRASLVEALAADGIERVLRDDGGRVIGHAGASVDPDNPFWGSSAGMTLCFAPEARGRGVLRAVYGDLLDAMAARGVRVFKGGTSQPAVLHLGRELGRVMHGVNYRREAPFDAAYFGDWLAP